MPTMTLDKNLSAVELVLYDHSPIQWAIITVGGVDAMGVTCKCGWNGRFTDMHIHQAEKLNSAPHLTITVGTPGPM